MDRIFTVCEGVYDGLIELAPDGAFLAYVGSNKISLSFGERPVANVCHKGTVERKRKNRSC